jgi:endonuclease-3
MAKTNWLEAFKPLFKKYRGKKHPLTWETPYQLVVKVILSARTSDKLINTLAPDFFRKYPTIKSLAKATPEELFPLISSVTNFGNKAQWLVALAQKVGDDKHLPMTMDELTELPGIRRKTANVIMSETGAEMEGVVVDLHVMRVAPRIGVAKGTSPEKIEKQLMEAVPQKCWRELGMSLTFLGREICRPTQPKCQMCPMMKVCEFYTTEVNLGK